MYRTILPICLAALGVGYIAMVVSAEGTALGFPHVLNDPGKVMFHVALLPTAAWVLAKGLPISLIASALSSHQSLSVASMLVLLFVGIMVNCQDAYDSVCVRPATPFERRHLSLVIERFGRGPSSPAG
jgi:hypothetical protein